MVFKTLVNPMADIEIGGYELDNLPGNSEVAVSHSTYLRADYRGRGLGQKQHMERLRKAFEMFYVAVICTVRDDNDIEKHILDKNGWEKVWTFEDKAGDKVHLYARRTGVPGEIRL